MKRILLLLGIWLTHMAIASNLQYPLNQIINRVDPNIHLGMAVLDLDTGETLYQRNPDQVFVPASNMKLISEAAALIALGPEYRFKNQLSTDAHHVASGVLKGNAYLYLPGDPSFSHQELNAMLHKLSAWSVHTIQGNVIIESSHQGVDAYAPGIVQKDKAFSYAAPLSPVMMDENRVMVTVNPAGRVGQAGLIECSPRNASFIINNHVKTMASSQHCGLGFYMDKENHLTVKGCIGMQQGAVQRRLAIQNPMAYLQQAIKSQLAAQGITLQGNIVLGHRPSHGFLLDTQWSKPIVQLMVSTLKPSDNLYADSLYLHAAEKLKGTPLNWVQAQAVVKSFLEKQTEISFQQSDLMDGSGLSRQDHLTPLQTVQLLQFLYKRFPLAFEYIAALPIAGQDGTLQRRLRSPNQQGLIRAKTGTMSGISSLSGYLYTANAHTLAFVMFINTRPKTPPSISGRYRSMVDTLCDYLLQSKPDSRYHASFANAHKRLSYQQQPSYADRQRQDMYKWRCLEYALKQVLSGKDVTILYRDHQLVLRTSEQHHALVWNALKSLRQKYSFSVALRSMHFDLGIPDAPHLFWINVHPLQVNNEAVWFVRETV